MNNDTMSSNSKLYGIIEGHKNISFVLDDFQCVFINSNIDNKPVKTIITSQGFVVGKTTEHKYVYIYAGKDFQISNMQILHTGLYFVSNQNNISFFDAISFCGGVLDKLFFKSSLEFEDYDMMKPSYKDDCKKYFLTNEKVEGELSIHSRVGGSISLERGNSLMTNGTELQIKFAEKKELTFLSEIFGYILRLCQFLTFRKNIRFEKIVLKKKSFKHPEIYETIADCFVHYDEQQDTQKNILTCITFNDVGNGIDNLISSIVNNKPKKPQFNVGFIPENDKDVHFVTSMKIREVCSALESEMELADITVEQEEEFESLVKGLKRIVKEHRNGEKSLTDAKAYDYILGTLRHLKGALADRIEECFMQHQLEIGGTLSREQIDMIVGYRNTITHGNYMPLNEELADITYILIKLVYCCILKRIGMASEKITDMMQRRVIS